MKHHHVLSPLLGLFIRGHRPALADGWQLKISSCKDVKCNRCKAGEEGWMKGRKEGSKGIGMTHLGSLLFGAHLGPFGEHFYLFGARLAPLGAHWGPFGTP